MSRITISMSATKVSPVQGRKPSLQSLSLAGTDESMRSDVLKLNKLLASDGDYLDYKYKIKSIGGIRRLCFIYAETQPYAENVLAILYIKDGKFALGPKGSGYKPTDAYVSVNTINIVRRTSALMHKKARPQPFVQRADGQDKHIGVSEELKRRAFPITLIGKKMYWRVSPYSYYATSDGRLGINIGYNESGQNIERMFLTFEKSWPDVTQAFIERSLKKAVTQAKLNELDAKIEEYESGVRPIGMSERKPGTVQNIQSSDPMYVSLVNLLSANGFSFKGVKMSAPGENYFASAYLESLIGDARMSVRSGKTRDELLIYSARDAVATLNLRYRTLNPANSQ